MRTLHDVAEQHQPKYRLHRTGEQLEWIMTQLLDFCCSNRKGRAQIGLAEVLNASAMGSSRPPHLAHTAVARTLFLSRNSRTGQGRKNVIKRRMRPNPRLQFTWGADRDETTVAQDGYALAQLLDFPM
jgi:hypothetical protein